MRATTPIDIKSVFPEVLRRLNSIHPLPSTGIVAGGAVANILWEMASGTPAVINDIDIFHVRYAATVTDGDTSPSIPQTTSRQNSACTMFPPVPSHDAYLDMVISRFGGERIVMDSVSRDGLLNTIFATTNIEDSGCYAEYVVSGFDINCVMVGYDLDTKELYYTQDFADFLRDGVLRVSNFITPIHSVLRLCQKADALQAHLDRAAEFKKISMFIRNTTKRNHRTLFGVDKLGVYCKYEHLIKPYFRIMQESEPNTGGETSTPMLYTLIPKRYKLHRVRHIHSVESFNFYVKDVYGDNRMEHLWHNLGVFWNGNPSYLDGMTRDEIVANAHIIDSIGKMCFHSYTIHKSFDMPLRRQLEVYRSFQPYIERDPTTKILLMNDDESMDFPAGFDMEMHLSMLHIKLRGLIGDMYNRAKYKNNPQLLAQDISYDSVF